MEWRRWRRRSAWGGAAAIAVGIVLFALFSDAGGACTANVIVLSDGVVGPHGCAASSIAYHAGIGLMVLGAALLIVACLLAALGRPLQAVSEKPTVRDASGPDRRLGGDRRAAAGFTVAQGGANGTVENGNTANGTAANGAALEPEPVALPPGWYGNPGNRDGAVQWWDGHRLVDRPPPTERRP